MIDEEYTVVINGKPQGPYRLQDLQNLGITANSFVRKPGMADYKEAHAMPELRELLGFSHQKTIPQYFATFDQRLLASAIDHFLIFGLYILAVLVSFIFINDKDERLTVALNYFPLVFLTKLIYGAFAESTKKQATLGKRLLSIKVSNLEGSRVSFSRSLWRNLTKFFSVLPVFFGYFYSFLNKKNQCWHDIAASTLVIKDRLI